ncbi:MAG: hypothetical protein ACK522_02970 [Synechococcaceae cyanobacterium]
MTITIILERNVSLVLFVDAIAVEIDQIQHPHGEIIFLWGRQGAHQQGEEDRQFFPLGLGVAEDRGQEVVAAHKSLGLALEGHLVVLVELIAVDLSALVQDRLQHLAVGIAEE